MALAAVQSWKIPTWVTALIFWNCLKARYKTTINVLTTFNASKQSDRVEKSRLDCPGLTLWDLKGWGYASHIQSWGLSTQTSEGIMKEKRQEGEAFLSPALVVPMACAKTLGYGKRSVGAGFPSHLLGCLQNAITFFFCLFVLPFWGRISCSPG